MQQIIEKSTPFLPSLKLTTETCQPIPCHNMGPNIHEFWHNECPTQIIFPSWQQTQRQRLKINRALIDSSLALT